MLSRFAEIQAKFYKNIIDENKNSMKRTRRIKRFGYEYKVTENSDAQYNDALGLEQDKATHNRTLSIDKDSDNIIDKFLLQNPISLLIGKKIWAIKDDNSRMFEGYIVDIYPQRILLCKINGINMPMTFDSVISMEG